MHRVGITGQSGFIGSHLYNTLSLYPDEIELVKFERSYFENSMQLKEFVDQCDTIVHLAALNRHENPGEIYNTNIKLIDKLIHALEEAKFKKRVIFSSSIQEQRDNPYGRSKHIGRKMLAEWAQNNDAEFSGLLIPNVFGPFGLPYYNSVVATFAYQLTHHEMPRIDKDAELKLIYVGELIEEFLLRINHSVRFEKIERKEIAHTNISKVSGLLDILERFKSEYFVKGVIPELSNRFEVNLFNTFRSFIDHGTHFPVTYTRHSDERGSFVETIRLHGGGQVSFSTTIPGITRGNHFHTRKIERFAVIKGRALIEMRKIGSNEILSFEICGDKPGYVDMPIWYTHNITNIGNEELYTLFWINEFYDPEDADTFYKDV